MNKKGFTLVELIGVVVILGLIALVAFPSLLNQINNSNKQISDSQKDLIIAATKNYVEENKNEYANKNFFVVDVDVLAEKNYIDKKLIKSYTDEENNNDEENNTDEENKLLVTALNGEYNVTVSKGNAKCEAVTSLTISGAGSVPTASNPFVYGAEYKCFVNEKESNQFYVLDENKDTVMLIMNKTFKDSITNWCKGNNNNNCGAVTAKEVLANKTKDWEVGTVLPDRNILVKANNGSTGTAASWMVTNFSDASANYWTSTPSSHKNYAYAISRISKSLNNNHQVGTYTDNGVVINLTYGIRPVIIVSKEIITYPQ